MFKKLHIGNFRLFDDFQIDQLSRINLVAGRNNSGKTTLLEALFLLSGWGNPELLHRINVFRGITELGSSGGALAAHGKPLFSNFDMDSPIEIRGQHSRYSKLTLTAELKRLNTTRLANSHADPSNPLEEWAIQTSFKCGDEKYEGFLRSTASGIDFTQPTPPSSFRASFLSSRSRNHKEDAIRLGQLRTRKQGDILTKALRLVEPRLCSVEDSSATGSPLIWGDIGLPELVPLSAMGDGMTRIANLLLAIANAPNGVVLVDEIENGIHHSVMNKVWAVVAEAAEQFDTQVFATTHSFECFAAAHDALGSDKWRYHRLDLTDEGVNCMTFETEDVEAAIRHGMEVR